jgi:hypothetical protein
MYTSRLKQPQLVREGESQLRHRPKLNNEQYQALIALHRALLLYEDYDFFLASQHPSATLPFSSLRKMLPVLLNGNWHQTCADRGSGANLISLHLARKLGLKILKDNSLPNLKLPISGSIRPIGRTYITCQFPNEPDTIQNQEYLVCRTLDIPVITGRPFLKDNAIFTKNKHRLKDATMSDNRLPCLFSMTGKYDTQERLAINVEGNLVFCRPDTGAAINAMSSTYARKNGHRVNRSIRKWVRLGDGSIRLSEGSTWATVTVGSENNCTDLVEFDIFCNLDVDVILGEEWLIEMDAFEKYSEYLFEVESQYLDFGSIVLLGLFEECLRALRKKGRALIAIGRSDSAVELEVPSAEKLEQSDDREYHRRRHEEERISQLSGQKRQDAMTQERQRQEQFYYDRMALQNAALDQASSKA